MLGRFIDRALELGAPGLKCLARAGIDEIERITLENRACDCDCIERLLRAVQAAKFLKSVIVERLHAERDTIDPGGAITAETRGFHAGRIGL